MNRRRFLHTGISLALSLPLATLADSPEEGFDYRLIDPPLTVADAAKVEVLEIFWYGCPHCYELQPLLEAWRSRQDPDSIRFLRMPAPLNDHWSVQARAFYALEAMGILERMHIPLFNAIHAEKKPLSDLPALEAFLVSLGADGKAFREAYGSFGVDIKVRQAAETVRRLKLDGVPVLLVGGRFLTSPTLTGNRERTIQTLDLLVGRLRDSVRS